MLDGLLDLGRKSLFWISSRANRLRVRGARIEIIAFIVARKPEPSILLAQSVYHGIWMPPQEGVNLRESFHDALYRCLEVECGLELAAESRQLARHMYVRSYRFVGTLPLAPERKGERPVADDAVGTALESVELTQKAYWMSTVVFSSTADIAPVADGKEILDLRWVSFPEAERLILTTNHPEKAELLSHALAMCRQDLTGGPSPQESAAHGGTA